MTYEKNNKKKAITPPLYAVLVDENTLEGIGEDLALNECIKQIIKTIKEEKTTR